MRRLYITGFVLLFLFFLANLYSADITVDGDLSEWTNQAGLTNVADPGGIADGGGGSVDINSNGISCDANYLYLYFKEVSKVVNWNYYDVYIDVDNNTNTGGKITFNNISITGAGVEFGLRISTPQYTWDDANSAGKWTNTAWSNYNYTVTDRSNNSIIEYRIPLSDIGISAGNTIGVIFYSSDGGNNDFNPDIKEIKFTIPLSPPVNISAISIADTKIKLFWDSVPGVTSYTLYRDTDSDPVGSTKLGGTTSTVFTDATVVNAFSQDYYYFIKSAKSGNTSDYSTGVLNTTGYPVINVDGSLTEWTQSRKGLIKNSDGSADTWGGYEILTNGIANDDTYLYIYYDLGANVDWINYNIYIDVDNNTGTGSSTNLPGSDTSVPMATFMGAEYGYRYTGSGGAFSWYSNSSGSWVVKVSTGGSVTSSANIIEIKIPLSEIKVLPGDIIGIECRSENQGSGADYDQNDDASEISYCLVGGTPPPATVPANVSAFIQSDTQINVSWQASSGATSYKVYRNTVNNSGSASLITSGVTNTYYNDTSVSSALSTKYYYWIKAVKSGAADSDFSSVAISKSYITFDDFDSYTNNTDLSNSWSVYDAWNASSTGNVSLNKNNLFVSNSTLLYVHPAQGVGNDEAVVMQKNLSFQNHSGIDSYILWTKNGNFPSDAYFYFGFNNYQWDSTDNATFTTFASNYIGMNYFKQIIITKSKITADTTFSGWNSVDKILLGVRETDTGGTVDTAFYIDKIIGVGVSTNSFPIVSAVSPANNSTYSMSTTSVPVSFTIGANMTNIIFQVLTNNTFYTTYRQSTISYDGNTASMSINLPEGTNRIVIDAVNKVNGLPLKQYVLTFNAIIPPSVKNLEPSNNSHQVATNTNIRFNIIDNIQVASNSVFIKINGSTVLSNGSFMTGWNGANSSIGRIGSVTNYAVIIDKAVPYDNNTKYTLTIIARDNNNNITTNISCFYTSDTIIPSLLNFNPAVGTVISPDGNISFKADDNLAVNSNSMIVRIGTTTGSATNWNTSLTNGGFQTGYAGSIVFDGVGGFDVTVKPDNDFTAGARIYIAISIADYGNNNITTNFYYDVQSDFTAPITTLSKPAGSYVGSFDLTLSVQDDSAYWIYYTLDGSDPLTSNTVISNYNSPVTFKINSNTTVKYYSKDIYNNIESVKTAKYEILNIPSDKAEVYNNYCDLSKGDKVRFVLNNSDSDVLIKVYNLKGKLVWSKNIGVSSGKELIEWNGVDNNGKKVGAGVYIVWIKGSNMDVKRKIIIVK